MARRCAAVFACIAVALLLAIVVFVWVQFGQSPYKAIRQFKDATTEIVEKMPMPNSKFGKHKELIEKSLLEDKDVVFVKPLKVGPAPLHDHDIIYDQMHNNQGSKAIRHHSGHFRHKQAEVWDPHPSYELDAFGRKLLLQLEHNNEFLGPNLHITTHILQNLTERAKHDPKMAGCWYTGKIFGEPESDISVSLCNGMMGVIRSKDAVYYIEPAEKFVNGSTASLLHRLQRQRQTRPGGTNSVLVPGESSECETSEKENKTFHNIIEDDFPNTLEVAHQAHHIHKREIVFDDMDTENYTVYAKANPFNELFRSTREADWSKTKRSNEYFVKVLVVADITMMEYHKDKEELTHYILTLMSHVALLYKDASIGNSVSISVVHIWIVQNESFSNSNSQDMLRKFCKWQERNTRDRQHDVALLLTRDTICKNSMCNTLGVAELASMCSSSSGCAIVRDKGLSTSYTIAHELGHVLGMQHDEDKRCQDYNKDLKDFNIMSKMMQNNTKPWMWSKCSKHFVTEFLESSRAKCLLVPPTEDVLPPDYAQKLPGETFSFNKQCELEFGPGTKICSFMPLCGSLWCTTTEGEQEGCSTQYLPWAEGTACGNRKVCHQGKCKYLDKELLQPVDGGWGPWQAWGECSRTCGGGVKMSKRDCDSPPPANGGDYCTGRRVRYMSCNTKDCNENEPDFRTVQCAEFNGITKNLPNLTADVEWVPKYGLVKSEDFCKLYCRPKNSNAYYVLKHKVLDGTKCGLTSFDICVNGICRQGGCDNKLDSKLELDDCGVCGGNNSLCEEITGTYNLSVPGYNRIVRIPKGSSNLDIRQKSLTLSSDENYLALVDGETGSYLLNGNQLVSTYEKDIIFGSLIIKYSGTTPIERITTPKNHKLTKDLVVEVLSVGDVTPPDVTYRYVIKQDSAPRYGWVLYQKQWSKCNSICSGTQYMRPVCIELAMNQQVPDHYCSNQDMESVMQKQECNTHCQLTWNVISKGPCSAHCGKGYRNVYYNCMKIAIVKEGLDSYTNMEVNHGEIVDEKHCSVLPKPPNLETCQGPCETNRWDYSKWSECSTTCGSGIQTRTAKCVNSERQDIDPSNCEISKRVTEQICNLQKCPVWSPNDWNPCSVTCGRGYRTRSYYCLVDNRIYSPLDCDQSKRPADKEECVMPPCSLSWETGQWTECSSSCGEGFQEREVFCKRGLEAVKDIYCRNLLKPNNTKLCNLKPCEELFKPRYYSDMIEDNSISRGYARWMTGPWGQCSQSCNGGVRSRKVVCKAFDMSELSDKYCQRMARPVDTVECNNFACPMWNFGEWGLCDSNCERHRQVSCQDHAGIVVPEELCRSKKPSVREKCPNCPYSNTLKNRYKWKVSKWKPCSERCGRGLRNRQVQCEDTINEIALVDQYCSHLRKPRVSQPCERYDCSLAWIESDWSACSKSCGNGTKARNVSCHRILPGEVIDPVPLPEPRSFYRNEEYCPLERKPVSVAPCRVSECSDRFIWRAGEWSQCSQPCGKKGRQIRKLYCINVSTGRAIAKRYCPKALRPARKRKCNRNPCLGKSCREIRHLKRTKENKDYVISIHGRPALVYCYKMDTPEPEEYISLHAEGQNYAEIYDRRLIDISSCPYNGARRDNCHCDIVSDRSGFTKFWKVRLNITSMKIVPDDFTFSRTTKGKRIAFATAGDCYSSYNCPQGRFSLDLSSTSFKLSQDVKWIDTGRFASSQINKFSDTNVVGKCGGYCGQCEPDPRLGLLVEIT